jgi:hypothetical protein
VRTNYILIDYENVQPKSLALLNGVAFKVLVFVGASQAKISLDMAKSLQALGDKAEYVQIAGNGSNALDFHIAFTIGELAAKEPEAYFHIISKDTGFDPLLQYLGGRKIRALRSKDIADIPLLQVAGTTNLKEKVEAIVRNLASRGTGRPRKTTTLRNTINSLFQNGLSEDELNAVVKDLLQKRYIAIDQDNVSYRLPSTP